MGLLSNFAGMIGGDPVEATPETEEVGMIPAATTDPEETPPAVFQNMMESAAERAQQMARETVQGAVVNNLPGAGRFYSYDGGFKLTNAGIGLAVVVGAFVAWRVMK